MFVVEGIPFIARFAPLEKRKKYESCLLSPLWSIYPFLSLCMVDKQQKQILYEYISFHNGASLVCTLSTMFSMVSRPYVLSYFKLAWLQAIGGSKREEETVYTQCLAVKDTLTSPYLHKQELLKHKIAVETCPKSPYSGMYGIL